jgi:outer membrane lipoprotein-sorting protein
MKKTFRVAAAILACLWIFVGITAAQEAQDVFSRVAQAYKNFQEGTLNFTMGMEMLGSTVEANCMLQKKGEKMRMEMEMPVPNSPTKMTSIAVIDETKMVTYSPLMKTAYTINIGKLPEEMKMQMRSQAFSMPGDQIAKEIAASGVTPKISKQTRDGHQYIVVQLDDLEKLKGAVPGAVQAPKFSKCLFWIDPSTYFISRIEFFSSENKPGMWIILKNIKAHTIPDDVFVLSLPDDVKTIDVTDTMLQIMGKRAPDSAQTETRPATAPASSPPEK